MMENMILSWENLQRRGHIGLGICALCKQDLDTTQHLMINCRFTQHVWKEMLAALNLNFVGMVQTYSFVLRNGFIGIQSGTCLPSIISWQIWLERNSAIFENGQASTTVVTTGSWVG
jgi:hypothetical protein